MSIDHAKLYVDNYAWQPMTTSLHKNLLQGDKIISDALLSIGQLSEEAQEARSKDIKHYRELFSRKTSRLPSESSTSLAGSYLNLPRFIPYSVHGPVVLEKDEELEKESNTVNYTDEEYAYSGEKKISFQVSPMEMIEDTAVLADDESETAIEEMVYEVEEYVEKEESDHFEHQSNDEEETSEH